MGLKKWFAILLAVAPVVNARYLSLIPAADGYSVYFEVPIGPVSKGWYLARATPQGFDVTPVSGALVDTDGTGAMLARSSTSYRSCGFSGSSCWLARGCYGSYSLTGPGFQYTPAPNTDNSSTRIALSESGRYVWIDQNSCGGLPSPPQNGPLRKGLYETTSLKQVVIKTGTSLLATGAPGRRGVTNSGEVLLLADAGLQWLTAAGTRPIRTSGRPKEAVTDAIGSSVAYVDKDNGELHWVFGPDWANAFDAKVAAGGKDPTITSDGSMLIFLAPDGSLQYTLRGHVSVWTFSAESYTSFAVGGRSLFAVTRDGSLIRIDIPTGSRDLVAAPFPEVRFIASPVVFPDWCLTICYGPREYAKIVSPGMLVRIEATGLTDGKWRARAGGVDAPLWPASDTAAWLQIPVDVDPRARFVELYQPGSWMRYQFAIEVKSPAIHCLATLHEDFTSAVTKSSPAVRGETVHTFLSGLGGAEPVPTGVANPTDRLIPVYNPPALADAAAFEIQFFGLAPGLTGVQQLDLKIIRESNVDLFSRYDNVTGSTFGCGPLPMRMP
jgi:uncharacterized protein (TIGR03437 family)